MLSDLFAAYRAAIDRYSTKVLCRLTTHSTGPPVRAFYVAIGGGGGGLTWSCEAACRLI
jgi:hypothetical protein